MATDPAVLWYFNDWAGGTITLSRFHKGCYADLLHAQFNTGHLSLDDIKTVLGSDFGSSWPALQKKFVQDEDGQYFNKRLDFELNKRKSYSNSRKKNRNGKGHMSPHMENENESSLFKDNISTNETNKQTNTREHEFQKHILEKCPRISKMEVQMTFENCETLESKYKKDAVYGILSSMENYKPLLKNNIDAYLTANKWLASDEKNLLPKDKIESTKSLAELLNLPRA